MTLWVRCRHADESLYGILEGGQIALHRGLPWLGAVPTGESIPAEAAALLDMKPATLAAWARAGHGPAYHLRGNRAWYRVADLTRWRETAEREAAPGPRQGRHDAAPDDTAPRLPGV